MIKNKAIISSVLLVGAIFPTVSHADNNENSKDVLSYNIEELYTPSEIADIESSIGLKELKEELKEEIKVIREEFKDKGQDDKVKELDSYIQKVDSLKTLRELEDFFARVSVFYNTPTIVTAKLEDSINMIDLVPATPVTFYASDIDNAQIVEGISSEELQVYTFDQKEYLENTILWLEEEVEKGEDLKNELNDFKKLYSNVDKYTKEELYSKTDEIEVKIDVYFNKKYKEVLWKEDLKNLPEIIKENIQWVKEEGKRINKDFTKEIKQLELIAKNVNKIKNADQLDKVFKKMDDIARITTEHILPEEFSKVENQVNIIKEVVESTETYFEDQIESGNKKAKKALEDLSKLKTAIDNLESWENIEVFYDEFGKIQDSIK